MIHSDTIKASLTIACLALAGLAFINAPWKRLFHDPKQHQLTSFEWVNIEKGIVYLKFTRPEEYGAEPTLFYTAWIDIDDYNRINLYNGEARVEGSGGKHWFKMHGRTIEETLEMIREHRPHWPLEKEN